MTGKEYSVEIKRILFRVISFIESEKKGPKIPLNNTLERTQACLAISTTSINNLKREMREIIEEEQQQLDAQKQNEDHKVHFLRGRTPDTTSSFSDYTSTVCTTRSGIVQSKTNTSSHRKQHRLGTTAKAFISVPEPRPPKKIGNVGRKSIILSEFAEDTIRYTFHQMLAEKTYPTIVTLLARLQAEYPDFPVQTKSTLLKKMKQLGFKYRKTSKLTIALE